MTFLSNNKLENKVIYGYHHFTEDEVDLVSNKLKLKSSPDKTFRLHEYHRFQFKLTYSIILMMAENSPTVFFLQ